MLKQITAIFLLIAFSVQVFNRTVIVLDYYTNTNAFAKNCENKALPMLHCNGKCQMMKKLREEEKKNQQNPERRAENKNEVLSSRSFFTSLPLGKPAVSDIVYSYLHISIPKEPYTDIFHPPDLFV